MTALWIVAAGSAAPAGLVALARRVGGDLTAAVVGDRHVADATATAGVDRVVWFGEPGDAPLEAFAGAVADAAAAAQPDVVFVPARDADRALAGAIAARLRAPLFTRVSDAQHVGGVTTLTHAIFGGIAEETVAVTGPVVIVGEGIPGDEAPGAGVPPAPIESVAARPDATLTVVDTRRAAHASVDLGTAQRIVAVGRGVAHRDDLALIDALADALDAEVACSRPLAEGQGWFGHDRTIGVTGRTVAPELYVAVGVSGQLQHVVGARGAGTVVVVNLDPAAPYFAECDYGLVGDLAEIVPAITSALAE